MRSGLELTPEIMHTDRLSGNGCLREQIFTPEARVPAAAVSGFRAMVAVGHRGPSCCQNRAVGWLGESIHTVPSGLS